MKRRILIITITLLVLGGALAFFLCYFHNRPTTPEQLPDSITEFMSTNFPDDRIISAYVDLFEYTVWTESGIEVEFDWRRNWDEITSFDKPLPLTIALLPPPIADYMAANYPMATIRKISKEHRGFELETHQMGIDFKFNNVGLFVGMDD